MHYAFLILYNPFVGLLLSAHLRTQPLLALLQVFFGKTRPSLFGIAYDIGGPVGKGPGTVGLILRLTICHFLYSEVEWVFWLGFAVC